MSFVSATALSSARVHRRTWCVRMSSNRSSAPALTSLATIMNRINSSDNSPLILPTEMDIMIINRKPVVLFVLLLLSGLASAAEPTGKELAADVKKRIDAEFAELEKLYKHLHSNPELSLMEVQTSARLVKELKQLGFEVTENVGGLDAHALVGVLKNAKEPPILVRTAMDA